MMEDQVVNAWLLAWNPKKYDWDNEEEPYSYSSILHATQNGAAVLMAWRCISTKVKAGDKIFIIRLGEDPKGIVACGYAASNSYEEDVRLVDILITSVLDYESASIFSQDVLKEKFPNQQWSPQGSGISIKPDAAQWLMNQWENFILHHEQTAESETEIITYLSEIISTLKSLGGTASLSQIYAMIENRGLLPAIQTNPNWKNNVNAEIQKHCNQTRSYVEGNENLFYPVNGLGNGVWGLVNETESGETLLHEPYTKQDFLHEVYMTSDDYDTLTELLRNKQNIILQGAPGVGKTFTAKRIAYAMMGEKDDSRIEFIQFHQSYSYEDFIMGYRPDEDGGFTLTNGVFYDFCNTARNDPDRDYFFIIDEINRGNLSKIFGELLMLIEKDYRTETARLAYKNEHFSVPKNLYLIGMMNTADRSLAMIDYALRRRFSFFDMMPGFKSDGFAAYRDSLQNDTFNALIAEIIQLNHTISQDSSLGDGFCIGHSYFCNLTAETCTDARLRSIVKYDILPLLREYWFDDRDAQQTWADRLCGVFHDE